MRDERDRVERCIVSGVGVPAHVPWLVVADSLNLRHRVKVRRVRLLGLSRSHAMISIVIS